MSMYRAGEKKIERRKIQLRTLRWKNCMHILHVFKDHPAVTAGTGGRVDITCAAEDGGIIAQSHCNQPLFSHVLQIP